MPATSTLTNFAVNNEGTYFPRVTASFTAAETSVGKLVDGNYWYHRSPPNRWTTAGSASDRDWCAVDFGTKRPIHTVKLYFLEDEKDVAAGGVRPGVLGRAVVGACPRQQRTPDKPAGRRANVVRFPAMEVEKVRRRSRTDETPAPA